ncbi:MAG TPA: 50S ribosomal protein L11 methyltransferase, partial [Candidatus Omnitrophota bacterium]|nr:50S ribosomal protein L11 methyltransferase [Candidatus Omnitrophota bacterium]
PEEIVECEQWPYIDFSVYFRSLKKAQVLKKKMRALRLRGIPTRLKILHKNDWQTKWQEDFKPFCLTRRFSVIPVRFKGKRRFPGRISLFLDTELAFGSGLHATTRFMAGFAERCAGRYRSFLDIGTGTGILAMIAFKCGAQDVAAIDLCRDAVGVAKKNFIRNKCSSIDIRVADANKYRTSKKYDFVAANLITQDLLGLGKKIVQLVRPGKFLAVSGISYNSYDRFRQDFAKYPLRCLKIEKSEGWAALLYKKIGSR